MRELVTNSYCDIGTSMSAKVSIQMLQMSRGIPLARKAFQRVFMSTEPKTDLMPTSFVSANGSVTVTDVQGHYGYHPRPRVADNGNTLVNGQEDSTG